jgi:aromatic-L-amino-acid/L-tryptophan decarboxylase
VVAALAKRYPEWETRGVRALTRTPAIYVSSESHHSFVKIARATGLGTEALRHVPVDDQFRMMPLALETMIAADRRDGLDPLMVVATAGTTGAGAIDPLVPAGAIAAREGLWYHVDAAWGGAAAFSPKLHGVLDGIDRADSITLDAHKWLSVPLGAGILLTRHPHVLQRAFGVDTGYVPPTETGAVDLYKNSMQWSRRFMGLKVLFAFAEHGTSGVGRLLEHQARMADLLRLKLRTAGWSVVNETVLPLVCFTHSDLPSDESGLRQLVDSILARGKVWISTVRLPGIGWALRACITSWQSNEGDLTVLLEELEHAKRHGAKGRL